MLFDNGAMSSGTLGLLVSSYYSLSRAMALLVVGKLHAR